MTVAEMEELKQAVVVLQEEQARLRREAEQKAEGIQYAIDLLQKEIDDR